jgi:plastocyanin
VKFRPYQVRVVLGIATITASIACYAGNTEIDQVAQRFSRSSASLAVGDTLTFVNHDDVRHNIRIIDADGNESDKGLQDPGQTIEAKFDKAGRFTARCAIHQKMKMTIDVK